MLAVTGLSPRAVQPRNESMKQQRFKLVMMSAILGTVFILEQSAKLRGGGASRCRSPGDQARCKAAGACTPAQLSPQGSPRPSPPPAAHALRNPGAEGSPGIRPLRKDPTRDPSPDLAIHSHGIRRDDERLLTALGLVLLGLLLGQRRVERHLHHDAAWGALWAAATKAGVAGGGIPAASAASSAELRARRCGGGTDCAKAAAAQSSPVPGLAAGARARGGARRGVVLGGRGLARGGAWLLARLSLGSPPHPPSSAGIRPGFVEGAPG